VKQSIQTGRERPIFFVEMGKITGAASLNGVPMLFQAPGGFRASKLLS
jgi:hypothetical protein